MRGIKHREGGEGLMSLAEEKKESAASNRRRSLSVGDNFFRLPERKEGELPYPSE